MQEFQFLLYNTPEKDVSVNSVLKDETIWLTQKAMAELFDVNISSISRHSKNVFDEREFEEKVVINCNNHSASALLKENCRQKM